MAPGVCLMVALTPSFFGEATNLSLFGQFTVVPAPGPLFHSSSIALRWVVKTNVVPLASARRTTVMSLVRQRRRRDWPPSAWGRSTW